MTPLRFNAARAFGLAATMVTLLVAARHRTSLTTDGSSASAVRRTTLLVHDIEKSVAFYQALGFTVWYDRAGKVSDKSLFQIEGVKPGDPNRMVIMKGRDPWLAMIGLLQYGAAAAAPAKAQPAAMRKGDFILMIEVTGVDAIRAKLKTLGGGVLREPEVIRVTGADGKQWDTKTMFCLDPDGHMIEATEKLN